MRKLFGAVLIFMCLCVDANAQTSNPLPGYIWTYFGPTLGAGWSPLNANSGLSIVNDFNPIGSVGYNPGIRMIIGVDPGPTPASGDTVPMTIYTNNLNGRGQTGALWALDTLTFQEPGGPDAAIHSIEVEVKNLGAAPNDPFANNLGSRKNGIELNTHGSSTNNPTSALWVWGASATTSTWWNFGLAISRVNLDGIVFQNYDTDTAAFTDAAIWDKSSSNRVLKVSGSHSNIFDFQGATGLGLGDTFIHLPQTYASNLLIKNFSNFGANLTLDSGAGTPQSAFWQFADNGLIRWAAGKDNGNSYTIFNVQTSKSDLQITTSDAVLLPNLPPIAAGTGKRFVCIDTTTHQIYEGTGVSCN